MDKVRFLMSDTSADVTAACRDALEQKGVEVTVVEKDGLQILQKMLAVRPQVVLLDAFMPGLDALAVKQKYVAAGGTHTTFFVTGAFQSEEMVQELLDEGFAYYFVKPFDETVCLLSKLNAKQHIEVDIHMDELDLTDAEKKATYSEIKEYVLEHTGLKVSSLYIAQVKQKCGIIERENYNKPKSDDAKQPQCPPDKEKAIKEALKHFGMI